MKVAQSCPTLQPHWQSMEISKPGYWSGQPFPSPGDRPNPGIEPRPPPLQADSLPAEPQGKPKNPGVGSLSLFQWIFLTQELSRGLLHYRQTLYQLSHREAKDERRQERDPDWQQTWKDTQPSPSPRTGKLNSKQTIGLLTVFIESKRNAGVTDGSTNWQDLLRDILALSVKF